MRDNESVAMFFIFLYIILVSYVVINMVIAILEIKYAKAKIDMSKLEGNTRPLNAILCVGLNSRKEYKQESRDVRDNNIKESYRSFART
jgi:hypothetical protein